MITIVKKNNRLKAEFQEDDIIMNRNLDGVYFRIKRDDKWENICFSDLTEEEMDDILKDKPDKWLRNMCKILGKTIKDIGEQLDIVME